MSYISLSHDDEKKMLADIGIPSVEELFSDIPQEILEKTSPVTDAPLSEMEAERHLQSLAEKNQRGLSFLGAGIYNHHVPAVVDHLTARSEFYTAYTPYQAEVSQGTLTAIFEFQTMIARLTGMDVANASMYDGATACAESVLMVLSDPAVSEVLVPDTLHPHYREVLQTYGRYTDFEIKEISLKKAEDSAPVYGEGISEKTGAAIVQYPDYYGSIPYLESISQVCQEKKVPLIVVVTEPFALGMIKAPGEYGVQVVCGEGQSLGNYQGFGGPLLGFLAVEKKYVRRMPGRLVGKTTDSRGNTSYTLTLQTREQHIRRERATSNICTNQGLVALRSVIFMSLTGGVFREYAVYNHKLAVKLFHLLQEKGFVPVTNGPFFNEFTMSHPEMESIYNYLKSHGIIPGKLSSDKKELTIAVTEMLTEEDIITYSRLAGEV